MNLIKLKRPVLTPINIQEAFKNIIKESNFTITMSDGQWDNFLEEAYFRQGATLLELDENEIPIAAYKKSQND